MSLTVLVCPGLRSQEVWIPTGDGKLFTALSATFAIACTAPEVTVNDREPGAVATSEMIRAWAESSPALSVATPRARKRGPSLPNRMDFRRERSPGLLDD